MTKMRTLINKLLYSFGFLILSTSVGWASEERSCGIFSSYLDKGDSFLLGPAYKIIAKACSKVAEFSWDYFAAPLQAVMALGVAIYIAVYTLRNIGSFSQQDTSNYLSNEKTGIIPLLIKSAFIIALLSNKDFVFEDLISPVVGTGIDVGKLVSAGSSIEAGSFSGASSAQALFNTVIEQAKDFNDQIYSIVAMGRIMLCLAFLPTIFIDWEWVLIPFGLSLYAFGWLLIISLSFYMLDILFRLGVALMVLPFAIACGISKLTSSYTKKTWDIFVNVAFNFMTLGVVITFTIKMLEQAITGGSLDSGAVVEGAKVMIAMVEDDREMTVAEGESIADSIALMSFILTALCCMIAMKLFMSIEEMTDSLSSTSAIMKDSKGNSTGLGAQAGKKVAQMGKEAATEPAQGIAKAAGQEIKDKVAGTAVGRAFGIGR